MYSLYMSTRKKNTGLRKATRVAKIDNACIDIVPLRFPSKGKRFLKHRTLNIDLRFRKSSVSKPKGVRVKMPSAIPDQNILNFP